MSVSAAIPQLQPLPPAFAIELNELDGNGSLTVTVDPSVGTAPTFETASVNVVATPPTKLPVWLLTIVRSGTATVFVTCGEVSMNEPPRV